jgi:hypothetical protein
MPCYRPLKGYRSRVVGKSGKRSIVFNPQLGFSDLPVLVPCGQCVGCRLERSRQWALRCTHEASLYPDNCFITLTFNDDFIPENRSLDVSHWQLFYKRLKSRVRYDFGKDVAKGIRFYHCGEYGSQFGRPHYHACIFNFDFPDKSLWMLSGKDQLPLYRSKLLEELWPYGYSSIGEVTFESAAYVARYIMKKVTGDLAESHYRYVDPVSGEVFDRKPDYTTMSNGIGRGWYERYKDQIYSNDFIVTSGGKKMRPPKFYDKLYEIEYPSDFSRVKRERKAAGKEHASNNTPDRLKVREKVQVLKLEQLSRKVE